MQAREFDMFADLAFNPLSALTLLLIIGFAIYQVRRMRRIKGRTKPSALAADGDSHDRQD